GRGREVIDEWRSRLDESARAHAEWDGYAELCLYVGDAAEYRRACDELLSRFESSSDPHVWERVGRACLFVQGTPDQARRGAELIDRALEADPESYAAWAHPYFQFALRLAEYRLGRYEAAVEALRSGASGVLRPAPQLVLAMALHRLGRTDEAKHSLARAVSAADWRPTRAVSREDWMYHLLRREAEAMILPDLAAMAAGERPPIDNDERLTLAALCIAEGRAAAAAQLFFEVFVDAPEYLDDPASDLRFIAACQAAVAAAGGMDDATTPDESGQALWRARARDWLRKELEAWAAPQRTGDPGPLVRESARLARWRDDPDLASIRNPDALARLTPQERDECTTLWNAVETAIRDAP
ncbi:MAG: tetratricopeptide repeat protein, partial [Phycisphaerales bacterium JB041]